MSPKISILIPVYNTEKTVAQTLDSVLNQTFTDLEIICVNDGSKDSSLSILNEYKEKYSNIKVISYEKNEGLARARFHGINAATGDYIMFLDSDDTLVPNACEIAYKEISKGNYDVVHFGANVIADDFANKKVVKTTQKYFNSKAFHLKNTEIFGDCYYHRRYNWNVWTKIYRSDLVKQIAKYIPEERCVMAEDMMIYFFISFFANKFKSIQDKLVNYSFGSGVSTQAMTLNSFASHLRQVVALRGIDNFMKDLHLDKNQWFRGAYYKLRDEIDYDLLGKFVYDVREEDAGKAFDEYLKYYSVSKFIRLITKANFINRDNLIRKIVKSDFVKPIKKENIKTIGMFYYRFTNGGVERVMSKLIPILKSLGYKVVLFVEKRSKKDFKVPSDVIIDTLPNSAYVSYGEYFAHAEEFKMKLIRHNIDLMLYQASVAAYLMEEILICKSLKIPFVITTHDYYSSTVLAKDPYMVTKRMVYSMCDAVQTITTDEEKLWSKLNVRARYIPNPLTFNPKNVTPSKLETNDILWVGRLDYRQKCPEYAIAAMELVTKVIPDAKLHIIGKGESKDIDQSFKAIAKNKKVSSNIVFHGFTKEVEKYYENASMLLMTSSYEVYPMVIGEAMSYGLPIVLFDLPYVELLKGTNCYLSSPQMNINQLANNIIRLLSDKDLRIKMGQASLNRIEEVSKFNIKNMWKNFINDIAKGNVNCDEDTSISTLLDITYDHWNRSLKENTRENHFYDDFAFFDKERFVVLDRQKVDEDALYSVLLQNKSVLFKAYFFLVTKPSYFLRKLWLKILRTDEKKLAAKKAKKLAEKKAKEKQKAIENKKKEAIKNKQKLLEQKKEKDNED